MNDGPWFSYAPNDTDNGVGFAQLYAEDGTLTFKDYPYWYYQNGYYSGARRPRYQRMGPDIAGTAYTRDPSPMP